MKSACLYKTLAEEEYIRFKSAEKGTQKIMQSHVQIFVRERKKRMHTQRERES